MRRHLRVAFVLVALLRWARASEWRGRGRTRSRLLQQFFTHELIWVL